MTLLELFIVIAIITLFYIVIRQRLSIRKAEDMIVKLTYIAICNLDDSLMNDTLKQFKDDMENGNGK